MGKLSLLFLLSLTGVVWSCKTKDPAPEAIPELVTKVVLTFTPSTGVPMVATATDPDGEGVQDMVVEGTINLASEMTYALKIELINGLYGSGEEGYYVSSEVEKEADEHQFFFEWSEGAFADPAGNGNVDNKNDPVNYLDKDENNLPLGLSTSWMAGPSGTSKSFRVLLKHQPGIKSSASSSQDGESDLDVTFPLNVN